MKSQTPTVKSPSRTRGLESMNQFDKERKYFILRIIPQLKKMGLTAKKKGGA